ncbi:MAG: dihydrodipicolinate synthase family protein [Alphaproteobacteria bacterium]|nr:dihydrodipicolinate synthase family protein [Alphaproteobacteria bacterium]
MSTDASGVYIISVTPFLDDGALDLPSTDRLVDFYLEQGVNGITILGMMGEAPKLSAEESMTFARRVLRRLDGRIPTIVGVSAPGLAPMRELAVAVMDMGAAGVMVAPGAGIRSDDGYYGYFAQVFATLGPDLPVVLQDYPQSTGVYLPVPVFSRLVTDFPQLVMLKHEDCPGLQKLSTIRKLEEQGLQRRVSILVGNGGIYYPQELARGADGAMTGIAFPEMLVKVYALHKAGRADEAEDLFDAYLPYVRHEQQPAIGLAVRKEVLRRRGAIASAKLRAPGPKLEATDLAELDRMLERLERRLAGLKIRDAA